MAKRHVYRVIQQNGKAVIISGKITGFNKAKDFMRHAFMHYAGISDEAKLSKTAKTLNAVYKERFAEFKGTTWWVVVLK